MSTVQEREPLKPFGGPDEAPPLDDETAKALILIALSWREHNRGPTWHKLAGAMGWSIEEAQAEIRWPNTGRAGSTKRKALSW